MSILQLLGYVNLTRGKKAIVDWTDVEWLSQWSWQCSAKGYAVRSGGFYMHVEIMRRHGFDTKICDVDHIDRNPLNNTLSNLRLATRSQNAVNAPKQKNNTSGYKGVTWNSKIGKWQARLGYNYERKFLGYYTTKEEAAAAVNKALNEFFGDFGCLNVDKEGILISPLEGNYSKRSRQRRVNEKKDSNYRGVSPTSRSKNSSSPKWLSQIFVNGKMRYLGTFQSQEDAAYIYNQVSVFLYGHKALVNELPETYEPSPNLSCLYCDIPFTKTETKQ